MSKPIYGVSCGSQGYGSGDLVKATEYRESTDDRTIQVKDIEGNWVDVYSVITVDESGSDILTLI